MDPNMPLWGREVLARLKCVHCVNAIIALTLTSLVYLTYGTLVLIFNPSFLLQNFYVPNSNCSLIFFDIIIQNKMDNVGIRYDAINLAFSYAPKASTSVALGTYTVPGFYQGMHKKAQRREVAVLTPVALSGGSTAEFGVVIETDVKFKNWLFYFKQRKITAWGGVVVDDSGKKVGKEPLELKSDEPITVVIYYLWLLGYIILRLACLAVGVFVAMNLWFAFRNMDPRTDRFFV